jgi:hypothetical protein
MSTETEWIKAIKETSDNSTSPFDTDLMKEAFNDILNIINSLDDDDPRLQAAVDIITDDNTKTEIFSETGSKIDELLCSDNIADVNQGLLLLETSNILQELFIDSTKTHSFFDFFELTVDKYCLFKELYDALFGKDSRYTHRIPILEFLVKHAPPALTWAQDLDAYLRISWHNEDSWPEREALSKTRLQILDGDIDDTFMTDMVRIKVNTDGTFTLITHDFQQIVCSATVLAQIALQFPEHELLLDTLLALIKDTLPDESIYPFSLSLRDTAATHSSRELVQALVRTLRSDTLKKCHWVRESAVSNPMFSLNELTEMVDLKDRYVLKGIVQNPNCSDELKAQVNELLQDEEKYPGQTSTYTLSSNTGTYGETAYMGLDELVTYCLKVHQDEAEYFLMNFELPEGVTVDQGKHFMDNLQQMAWGETLTHLGSFENCSEVEKPRPAKNGWLLLDSMVKSNCEYEDELQGTVYFELQLEYPLDPAKLTWHTDSRGKWGVEYDETIYRGQSGSPDYQGGYATALKLFIDGEWKELPSIIGTSWHYEFLLKGCDVDKSLDTARADMKVWLLENHPDLKQAITSIHPAEQTSPES